MPTSLKLPKQLYQNVSLWKVKIEEGVSYWSKLGPQNNFFNEHGVLNVYFLILILSLLLYSHIMQSSSEKGGIRIEYAKTKMGEVHEWLFVSRPRV